VCLTMTVFRLEHNVTGKKSRKCSAHRGSIGPAEPLLRTTATANMAAASFVVITNGEGCALTGTADIDQ